MVFGYNYARTTTNDEGVSSGAARFARQNIKMRITKVELKNIRCFEEVTVDLSPAEDAARWSVILGDNGVGKSTLLRSIALGVAPPETASAMLADGGPWLRRGSDSGHIRVSLDGGGGETEIRIRRRPEGEAIIQHTPSSKSSGLWRKLFVCGYGAGRSFFGETSYPRYSVRHAVSTLFTYNTALQNPELMLRRLVSPNLEQHGTDGQDLLRWIDNVLMLPEGSTRMSMSGLEISGPWGTFAPVGSLGDGYKATLAWILDMVGWAMLRDSHMLVRGIEGIVLVDEIEQHLHPLWQRRILGILHRQFPRVQFITTTHSPLCVIGTTDFEDEQVSLIHLRQADDCVAVKSGIKPPRGLRADQVLTSYLFGLETTSDDKTKFEIERLSKLLSRERLSDEQQAEVESLRASLDRKLGTGETELERRVSSAVESAITADPAGDSGGEPRVAAAKRLSDSALTQVADLELKRQFKELLGKL